jgi:hypothetical protein
MRIPNDGWLGPALLWDRSSSFVEWKKIIESFTHREIESTIVAEQDEAQA